MRLLMLWVLLVSLPACAGGDSLLVSHDSKRTPWGFFASGSFGYTHYQASDLNDVMVALEQQSAEAAGLNHYAVDNFNGHPRQSYMIGAYWGAWRLGLEVETWVENFHQDGVPFYMNRDLDPRFPIGTDISCEQLQVPGFTPVEGGTAGCIDAQEIFQIVPLTLQLSRSWAFQNNKLWLSAGIGSGVLAGDAKLIVKTDYIGDNSRTDDTVELTLYPGVNLVHKAFAETEYRPLSWLGFSLKGSYRYSQMDYVELQEKKGDSFLFGLVLGQNSHLEQGSRAYLLRTTNGSGDVLVLRSPPSAEEIRQAELAGNHYDLVQGDFSGWMIEAKVNLWWGIAGK